ncbi:unnamed protein product [Paramecium pentaurelia]|uniref:Protein kinase domain-containing protein n=1 Tax=Paramecium pentaurelia TaxID=43138 RepID=A0A8S1U4D7_9CILI|nr:unnamed protein product [Paramecium pentaurelia]
MIGKYKICEPIGQGYSCKVYRAQSQENNQFYAIKVINHQQMSEPQIKLLGTEIEILQTLNCQNIIKLFDIIKNTSYTFIITELCQYGSLEDQMNKNKQFNEVQALNFLNQMCNALLTLKKQKIIHNDIKPSNIFISQNCFKLADFGFAIKENSNYQFNFGSPLYMSPETLTNNQHTYQSDIWSLGITLYQLIHGYTPFKAQNEKELLLCYLNNPIQFNKEISPKLQAIISNMLTIDPQKRITIEKLQILIVEKENNMTSSFHQRTKSLSYDKQPFQFKEQTLNICLFVKSVRQEIQDNELLTYALTGLILYYTKQEQENEYNQITVIVQQQKQPNIFQMVKSDLLKFCMSQLILSINLLSDQLKQLNPNFYHVQKSNVRLLVNLYNLYMFLRSGEQNRQLVLASQNITFQEAQQLLSQINI